MSKIKWLLRFALSKIKSIFSKKISFFATILNSDIDRNAAIRQKSRIYGSSIGKYSYVARNTLIQNTEIGSFCSISEGCNIGMPSHPTDFISSSPVFLSSSNYLRKNFSAIKYESCPKTIIGHDVWIGAHAQIKSGVKIGNGSIIAAGAVVTHDVPDYAIVGGVPAKIIRYRFDEETIIKIQRTKWWEFDEKKLTQVASSMDDTEEFIEKCEGM